MTTPPSNLGYVLYVDESGDDGFDTVRPIDPDGGSEWMVLAGVLLHAKNHLKPIEWVRDFKRGIKGSQRPDLHFLVKPSSQSRTGVSSRSTQASCAR